MAIVFLEPTTVLPTDLAELGHHGAPGYRDLPLYASSPLPNQDKTGALFEIASPKRVGKTRDELIALFEADQAKPETPVFSHPLLAGALLSGATPVGAYCNELSMLESFHSPEGVQRNIHRGDYSVLALTANEDDETETTGTIVAMADFSVELTSPLDEEANWADATETDCRTLCLTVFLDSMYTLKSHRGTGAASALAEYIGEVVYRELEHLAKQLLPHAIKASEPFTVEIILESDWFSLTGELMHFRVLDELCDVRDAVFNFDYRDNPEFVAISLPEVSWSADYSA